MEKHTSPLDPRVLVKLKGLKLQVQRVVEGVLAGLHRSARHGVSIEFAEHKQYSVGDDPKHLDWKVLGRLDRYAIKKYEDETNLQSMMALDFSGSMAYASGHFSKAAYASVLACSLAALVLRQGDSAGLIVLSGTHPCQIPPLSNSEQLTEIVTAIERAKPSGETVLREAASLFVQRTRRRGMLVLFSDLFDPDEEMLSSLKMLAARGHQVVVFHVLDQHELEFPFEDPAQFMGMENQASLLAYPREVKRAYLEEMQQFLVLTRRALTESGLVYELTRTDEPFHQPLLRLLSKRGHRFHA